MGRITKSPIIKKNYAKPTPDGWAGWVEDKGKTWLLYFGTDGKALFYPKRDGTGAVIGEGIPA